MHTRRTISSFWLFRFALISIRCHCIERFLRKQSVVINIACKMLWHSIFKTRINILEKARISLQILHSTSTNVSLYTLHKVVLLLSFAARVHRTSCILWCCSRSCYSYCCKMSKPSKYFQISSPFFHPNRLVIDVSVFFQFSAFSFSI